MQIFSPTLERGQKLHVQNTVVFKGGKPTQTPDIQRGLFSSRRQRKEHFAMNFDSSSQAQ